jgi:dGTPase
MGDVPFLVGIQTVAQRESRLLAPYAMHSANSRGRRYPETTHPYRGPFQRDRDRIVHSGAYRRLSGKMQVFTGERGDYHRTRLTHTQEVASIARTVGRALQLNEDLIEALALFHDIGHPPFGHAGEDALDECLSDDGGFSHNRYALTIAEELEQRYHRFPGLNLTWEVLEGQATRAPDVRGTQPGPLLEVQVVEAADSITYNAHDTDDAVKLGLVKLDELAELSLVREAIYRWQREDGGLDGPLLRAAIVHDLIDRLVSDVLQRCGAELNTRQFRASEEARQDPFRIGPSAELAEQKRELERFLYERVYRHPDLVAVREQAQRRLVGLFNFYLDRPRQLPVRFQQRAETSGLRRAIADYLAGMTDRYCDSEYERLVEPLFRL